MPSSPQFRFRYPTLTIIFNEEAGDWLTATLKSVSGAAASYRLGNSSAIKRDGALASLKNTVCPNIKISFDVDCIVTCCKSTLSDYQRTIYKYRRRQGQRVWLGLLGGLVTLNMLLRIRLSSWVVLVGNSRPVVTSNAPAYSTS